MRNVTSRTLRALWNGKKWWFQRANNSSGKQQWHMTPSNKNPSKSGLNRGISLLGYCTGKSTVTPTLPSKRGMRTNTEWHVSECANMKTSAKLEKGMRRGWDVTSSLLVFRTPFQRGPCIYSENVPGDQEIGRVTPLKTEVWKHRHKFILHTFYLSRPASGCHAVRPGFCLRTSGHRRMGVILNSPTKGRVKVVQLNCCYTTTHWTHPFLAGPERGFESDSCKWIYMSFKN